MKSWIKRMLIFGLATLLVTGLLIGIVGCSSDDSNGNGDSEVVVEGYSEDAVELSNASIVLWDDFAFWAYDVIVAAALGQPNLESAVNRWNQVADDLGGVVGAYYGMDAGDTATTAIKQLQTDAIALVTAVLGGDAAGQQTATDALGADIEAIATFLDGANPDYWPYDTVLAVLQNILDYTVETATAIITGSWDASVVAFDQMRNEVMVLANTFSSGVIEQFPDEF